MKIYLMRHYKVDCHINFVSSSGLFDSLFKQYLNDPVFPQEPLVFDSPRIYTSNLSRSIATANNLKITSEPIATELLNEVPVRSPFDTPLLLSTTLLYLVARFQWRFGIARQPESYDETHARISKLIDLLESETSDCLLVGHGFLFFILKKRLKKAGYLGKTPFDFKNGEVAVLEKL